MGLRVDTTLDLVEEGTPATPAAGLLSLYSKSDSGLYLKNSAAVEQQVMTTGNRSPGWYTYSGAGTPTGVTGMQAGDFCVRQFDGEVFEYISGTWVDQSYTLQGSNVNANAVARAYRNASLSVTTWQLVPMDTASFDPGSHFSSGIYHCPVSGYYQVSGQAFGAQNAFIARNGTVGAGNGGIEACSSGSITTALGVMFCNAGDTIGLYAAGSATALVVGNDFETFLSVSFVAPVTAAPVTSNTAARAYRNGALTLTASTWTKVPLDAVAASNDPGGHMDVATNHRYNVAATGWYQVNAQASANTTASGQTLTAAIYKNGASVSVGSFVASPNSVQTLDAECADLVYCAAGDYLELWAYSGAALIMNALPLYTWMSVVQVDQAMGPAGPAGVAGVVGSRWFSYSGTGTPTGLTGINAGDFCIREFDGEVFEYISGAWVDQSYTLQGSNVGATNVGRAYFDAALTVVANTWTKVPVNKTTFDPGAHWDVTTHYRFNVTVAGYYQVNALAIFNESTTGTYTAVAAAIYKNGVNVAENYIYAAVEYNAGENVSDVVECAVGDYLELWVTNSQATSIYAIANTCFMAVSLVAPVTAAPVTPNTGSRASLTSNFSPSAGAWNRIGLQTVRAGDDPGAHWDTSNGWYVCPATGLYLVTANIGATVGGGGASNFNAWIGTDAGPGASEEAVQFATEASIGAGQSCFRSGSTLMRRTAGDKISLWVLVSAATTILTNDYITTMSVVKVDQPSQLSVANGTWQNAVGQNGWTSGSNLVQYMKDALGFVHLRGDLVNSAGGTVAFTLPVGFRPGTSAYRGGALQGGGAAGVYISISTAGDVVPTMTGSNSVYLDGIAPFLAEH